VSDDEAAQGKPHQDTMDVVQPGNEDPVGDIAALAADPDSDNEEILRKLNGLASTFSREEIFTALVRFDTPDVLG
jgi:hypothetical protein